MNSTTLLFQFDNSYARLPKRFFTEIRPETVPSPRLLAWNSELASDLALNALNGDNPRLAEIFSGNLVPSGSEPIALAYAGHQFGHFVPQLGDGRAHLLGEVVDGKGARRDIQLKGSGRTPFSRNGDGKAALGPVIREYIVSEAMHHLGIPTTRALSAVQTGEWVQRETMLPGAVITRVAASHIRVGSFEYFAARNDLEALQTLCDYAISRHCPEAAKDDHPSLALFRWAVERQAQLVTHWMGVGFIHGVMNTDNMAISGETIDYGPCAFLDEFDYQKVFSSIDRHGRYAFSQQGGMAQWNLARLGECLLMIGGESRMFEAELARFSGLFEQYYLDKMRAKLGLTIKADDDQELANEWLQYLQDHTLDYTQSYRRLATQLDANEKPMFGEFEAKWRQRLTRQKEPIDQIRQRMDAVNPAFIPRNHQIEKAIQAAIAGDLSIFYELCEVLCNPYEDQPRFARYAEPPFPQERVTQTFCGT